MENSRNPCQYVKRYSFSAIDSKTCEEVKVIVATTSQHAYKVYSLIICIIRIFHCTQWIIHMFFLKHSTIIFTIMFFLVSTIPKTTIKTIGTALLKFFLQMSNEVNVTYKRNYRSHPPTSMQNGANNSGSIIFHGKILKLMTLYTQEMLSAPCCSCLFCAKGSYYNICKT